MRKLRILRWSKWKRLVVMVAVVLAAYLLYFGLPPHSSPGYMGPPPSDLEARIRGMMSEIHPDQKTCEQVQEVFSTWGLGATPQQRDQLQGLGRRAISYIEEKTRSTHDSVRIVGYEMLAYASAIDEDGPTNQCKDYRLPAEYIYPIWERGLYDSSAVVRRMAIKRANARYLGSRGVPIFRRMLRDPSEEVRIAAARQLIGGYRWPRPVPMRLFLQARYGEVE